MLIDVLNHGIIAILSASLAVIDAPEAARGFACIDAVATADSIQSIARTKG